MATVFFEPSAKRWWATKSITTRWDIRLLIICRSIRAFFHILLRLNRTSKNIWKECVTIRCGPRLQSYSVPPPSWKQTSISSPQWQTAATSGSTFDPCGDGARISIILLFVTRMQRISIGLFRRICLTIARIHLHPVIGTFWISSSINPDDSTLRVSK